MGDKHIMCTIAKSKMTSSISTRPQVLKQIKQSDWLEIYYTVAAKLQPEAIKCANCYYEMKMRMNGEFIIGYCYDQHDMQRNGHDSLQRNETVNLNITLHNCLVVAQCAISKVNSILAKYNIAAATLMHESLEGYTVDWRHYSNKELMIDGLNLPTGVQFCAVD